jgi:hypothetical protein
MDTFLMLVVPSWWTGSTNPLPIDGCTNNSLFNRRRMFKRK